MFDRKYEDGCVYRNTVEGVFDIETESEEEARWGKVEDKIDLGDFYILDTEEVE